MYCQARHIGVVELQNRIKMAYLCTFKVVANLASWLIWGRPSWKSIRPKLTILTFKNGNISKSQFAQVSITRMHTPLHFSMNLSETSRIVVNMDFANTNHGRFLGKDTCAKWDFKIRLFMRFWRLKLSNWV